MPAPEYLDSANGRIRLGARVTVTGGGVMVGKQGVVATLYPMTDPRRGMARLRFPDAGVRAEWDIRAVHLMPETI